MTKIWCVVEAGTKAIMMRTPLMQEAARTALKLKRRTGHPYSVQLQTEPSDCPLSHAYAAKGKL